MLLHWLDFYDHKAIALVGGGTTLVGDPSGKDSSRKILSKEDIDKNISRRSNRNFIANFDDDKINIIHKGMLLKNFLIN